MVERIEIINGREFRAIEAGEGSILRRKLDGLVMGTIVYLGNDWSTGKERKDLPEYYEEVEVAEVGTELQ